MTVGSVGAKGSCSSAGRAGWRRGLKRSAVFNNDLPAAGEVVYMSQEGKAAWPAVMVGAHLELFNQPIANWWTFEFTAVFRNGRKLNTIWNIHCGGRKADAVRLFEKRLKRAKIVRADVYDIWPALTTEDVELINRFNEKLTEGRALCGRNNLMGSGN